MPEFIDVDRVVAVIGPERENADAIVIRADEVFGDYDVHWATQLGDVYRCETSPLDGGVTGYFLMRNLIIAARDVLHREAEYLNASEKYTILAFLSQAMRVLDPTEAALPDWLRPDVRRLSEGQYVWLKKTGKRHHEGEA